MSLTRNDLQVLLTAFDDSPWDEMTLVLDGERVELTKTGRPPTAVTDAAVASADTAGGQRALPSQDAAAAVGAPAEVSSASAVEAGQRQSEETPEQEARTHRVTAPSVGVFWRSPEPSAPPFIEVGQRVRPEDPVCIVEVMKLFNHVQAGVSGTVRSVEVDNGAMVEHGQPLFVLELEG